MGDPGTMNVLTDSTLVNDTPLTVLDQAVVLALCLDVKNHNPMDGLTYEEMKPYVARVMHKDGANPSSSSASSPALTEDESRHLDTSDWMTYSTALMIKALLEFENYKTMCARMLTLPSPPPHRVSCLAPPLSRGVPTGESCNLRVSQGESGAADAGAGGPTHDEAHADAVLAASGGRVCTCGGVWWRRRVSAVA